MKEFNKRCAQGDCLLRKIDKLPDGLIEVKPKDGSYIVAESETHHHHVIKESPNVKIYDTENPLLSYLEVIEATDKSEVILEHLRGFDTHESIKINPGIYEIRRQREWTPEGWRRAAD